MQIILNRFKAIFLLGMLFSIIIACETKDATTVALTPAAPDSLVAVASDSAAVATWELSDKAENYVVYLSDSEFGIYKAYLTTNALSAKVTNLTNDKTYWIKVVARNIYGKGGSSVTVQVTPKKPLERPAAPSIQSVILSDTSVYVSWKALPYADSYNLYYSIDGGAYILYKSTAAISMRINDIIHNKDYKIYITAQNSAGISDMSATFEFQPTALPVPATYPSSIIAYPGNNAVTLFWQGVDNATSYAVYISSSADGTFTPIGSTADSYFTANNLLNDTTYYFKVASVNYSGVSALSPVITSAPSSVITRLDRPKNIISTPGDAVISLEWDEVINASGYNIYISTQEYGGFSKLSSTTDKFFTVTELTNDTVYYFIITAYKYTLEGERSAVVASIARKMESVPLAPTAVSIFAGDTIDYLEWEPSLGTINYKVLRSEDNSTWVTVATVTTNAYTDKSLVNLKTYYYNIVAINRLGSSTPSATVSATPNILQTLPTLIMGVSVQNIDDYFRLTWDKNLTANYYNIYMKKSTDVNFIKYRSEFSEFINIAGLEDGITYNFYITGVYGADESGASVTVSSTYSNLLVAPSKPENLTATAVDKVVTISWQAVNYAKSYIVYIAKKSDSVFLPMLTTNTPGVVINFLANDDYYVKVVATNNIGISPASDTSSFKIKDAAVLPGAPINITAIAGDNSTSLSWKAVFNATGYAVYMSTNDVAGFSKIGDATHENLIVNGLSANTTYYFYIVAMNTLGEGAKSVIVSATPYTAIIPTTINGVHIYTLNKQIYFTWLPTNYARSYKIERKDPINTVYFTIAHVELAKFYDFDLTNGTAYTYKITAVNEYGEGTGYEFTATPAPLIIAPQAPTYLKATSGYASVLLEYSKSLDAYSYKIYKKITGGTFEYVGDTISQLYTVKGLTNGTQYTFTVRAVNAAGDSVDSITAVATPLVSLSLPVPPTSLSAAIIGNNIKLSWSNYRYDTLSLIYINDNVSFAANDYVLYAVASGETFVFNGLQRGRTYKFKIRPINNTVIGDFSEVLTFIFPVL